MMIHFAERGKHISVHHANAKNLYFQFRSFLITSFDFAVCLQFVFYKTES